MKTCSLIAVAAVLVLSVVQAGVRQPNIIHIVADDIGWKDLGFQGASDIRTPNLDLLAREGARFAQFYVQPMCTPTRAALLTGRYPMRYGLQTLVIPSKGTYGLSTDEFLLPQVLAGAGYTTGIIGKWHLGHADRRYWPRQRGFDYAYGAVLGEIDYFTHAAHGVTDWQRNNEAVKEDGYVTTLLGDDAVRFVEGKKDADRPFFLYLAFTAPHAPYQAPAEYIERFRDIPDPTRRTYAAMISCLDDQVGRVVEALERTGQRDRTLILFHSDNGGTRDARLTGESKVETIPCDNGPLRGGKGELYEGGTRVPAFANWPGRIPPGTVIDTPVHVVDILPTFAALAGASTEKCLPLDGLDVSASLLSGEPSGRSEIVYNIEPFRAAIRQGDWKLVWQTLLPSKAELFNLVDDPNETRDVSAEHPQKVAGMQARLEQLATEAQKPLFFATGMKAVSEGIFGPAPIPTGEPAEDLP
jgi:arylsulfatase A-like enzyme